MVDYLVIVSLCILIVLSVLGPTCQTTSSLCIVSYPRFAVSQVEEKF